MVNKKKCNIQLSSMEPDIFQLDEKTCCLSYNKFLVVNLPLKNLNECLESLGKGKYYHTPSYLRQSINNLGYPYGFCYTINLSNDRYKIYIHNQNGKIRIKKGLLIYDYEEQNKNTKKTLQDWMIALFYAYNINCFVRKIPVWRYWFIWFFCILVSFLFFIATIRGCGAKNEVFFILSLIFWILILPTILIVLFWIKKNITEIVFFN